ncbi:efflux transporter periplasmic adaptor subunit, partial [Lactobacillus crispatus]
MAAGVFAGATLPAVSGFVRGLLTAVGVPPSMVTYAAGPATSAPAKEPAKGPAETADDGHDHGKPSAGKADGQARGEHEHSESEGEEGHIKMSAEQVENQDIKVAKAEGGTISRHILAPGTITPDTDRIARVPVRV